MAVDIEELIINPFKEVVQRGNEAVENAESTDKEGDVSQQMAKAGRAIAKEGERALKKLQPLWDGHVERYGDVFKSAMREHDDVATKRRVLDDLLYDFDDFISLENFKEARFTELQAVTRSFALDVLDIIRRLQITRPKEAPPSFPPLPPLPPMSSKRPQSRQFGSRGSNTSGRTTPMPSGRNDGPSNSPPLEPKPLFAEEEPTSRRRITPLDIECSNTKYSQTPSVPDERQQLPLPRPEPTSPPQFDLADIQIPSSRWTEQPPVLRAPRSYRGADVLHPVSPLDETLNVRSSDHRMSEYSLEIPSFPLPRTSAWVTDQAVLPLRPRAVRDKPRDSIPEHEPIGNEVTTPPIEAHGGSFRLQAKLRVFPPEVVEGAVPGARSSNASFQDHHHHQPEPNTPASSTHLSGLSRANSTISNTTAPSSVFASGTPVPSQKSITGVLTDGERSSSLAANRDELPPLPPSLASGTAEFDDGLMLAEDWATVVSDGTNTFSSKALMMSREGDCSIGGQSSLFQLKGFCEGAQAFRTGGHWQGINKTSGYVAGATSAIGRCISCGYAHHYDELSMDMDRSPAATFTQSNVKFRVRLLYKSHLHVTKMTEAYYGCLFCAQTGSVVREGDATVFATSDQLLRHLARHPQPLPKVPGLTVLYGNVVDVATSSTSPPPTPSSGSSPVQSQPNEFDLHFLVPPQAPAALPVHSAGKPAATATRSHLQRWGEKKLAKPEKGSAVELLQFFVGARMVGVEFPARWEAKWATGWHDGEWGCFPAKYVEVEKPRRGEVPPLLQSGPSSSADLSTTGGGRGASVEGRAKSVVTRWKWEPKDAAERGWLGFDKGETISNIGWLARDSWCWSGMNSKGKYGVFPRSHVKAESLKEEAATIGKPLSKKSSSRSGKLFGLGRRASTGASSIGGTSVVEIILQ